MSLCTSVASHTSQSWIAAIVLCCYSESGYIGWRKVGVCVKEKKKGKGNKKIIQSIRLAALRSHYALDESTDCQGWKEAALLAQHLCLSGRLVSCGLKTKDFPVKLMQNTISLKYFMMLHLFKHTFPNDVTCDVFMPGRLNLDSCSGNTGGIDPALWKMFLYLPACIIIVWRMPSLVQNDVRQLLRRLQRLRRSAR